MTLGLTKFECGNCGNTFDAPDAQEYGVFILRSKGTGEPAVLHALNDPVYEEVDRLLRSLGAYGGTDELGQAETLQRAFGVACDLAGDGTCYEIGAMPSCPVCQARVMASWEPTGKPLPPSSSLQVVTHNRWALLAEGDKLGLILRSLKK